MKSKVFVYSFVFLTILYLCGVFLVPTDPTVLKKYDITQTHAHLLNIAIVIPLTLIWLMALRGFINLRDYAHSVQDSKEGRPFQLLSIGLMILAFSLPLNAIISTGFNLLVRGDKDFLIPTTIIKNYITLLFAMAVFTILSVAAAKLVRTYNSKSLAGKYIPNKIAPILITLSALYAWLITSKPLNQGDDERIFYMPGWLVVFTIVIPYLLAWKAGMLAAYNIYLYRKNVKGVVYKQAFADIAKGIGVVVFVSIFIQLLTTSSSQLTRLNLTPLLWIIYLLLIMYAVGYGYVARGAKRLKRIEEV